MYYVGTLYTPGIPQRSIHSTIATWSLILIRGYYPLIYNNYLSRIHTTICNISFIATMEWMFLARNNRGFYAVETQWLARPPVPWVVALISFWLFFLFCMRFDGWIFIHIFFNFYFDFNFQGRSGFWVEPTMYCLYILCIYYVHGVYTWRVLRKATSMISVNVHSDLTNSFDY